MLAASTAIPIQQRSMLLSEALFSAIQVGVAVKLWILPVLPVRGFCWV